MIGTWLKFGEGQPPEDGEALVFARFSSALSPVLGGASGELVPAIYRNGMLYQQDGNIVAPPYGQPWTSLPHPRA